MDFTTLPTIMAIVVICYLIGAGVKAISAIDDKFIPVIVGVCGGLLGVVGMLTMPEFPASNVLDAIAYGAASGLTSTGVNQVFKQLGNKETI